jgi:hypothetical protein
MPKYDASIACLLHQLPRLAHIFTQRALKLQSHVQSSATTEHVIGRLGARRLQARMAQPQKVTDVEFGSLID